MTKSSESNPEKNKNNNRKPSENSNGMRNMSDAAKYIHNLTEPARETLSYIDTLRNFTNGFDEGLNEVRLGQGHRNSFWTTSPSIDNQLKLNEEINELKKKLALTTKQLLEVADDKQKVIDEFNQVNSDLQAKEKISHILPRINEDAKTKLLTSQDFLKLFENGTTCDAVVVSIDIRRSTELMLKARKPELFSKFITELSRKLSENIISNYGIFDKFTGDGILAFFPKFYSGDEAIIRALKASEECHEIFNTHYHDSKFCFNVFINDVGLGIGIDYGNVTLVNTSNELTVVGIPVVYACRMSGAKAGDTILNQPAKEEIERLSSSQIKFTDATIQIKNEGTAEVYKVDVNRSVYDKVPEPEWTNLNEEVAEEEEPEK